jgi:hypothetical protein
MRSAVKYALCLTTCLIACLAPARARAQTPARDGKLALTVTDPLGAVVQGATVTITGIDDTTKASTIAPLKTTDKGVGTIDTLIPGRYDIKAEFPGFELGVLKDVRIRSGENKHAVVLPLKKVEDSVTVTRDKQDAAADRSLSFGSALTREQIDALSDDPDEMRRQLSQMAPDARIIVDSFEGGELPPKSQIKSIRITRDQFAAENHFAGGISIEIITQPGLGALRGGVRMGFLSSALDGNNPLVNARGPAQNRNFGGNVGGTIKKDKASFSLNLNGGNSYETPVLYTYTPSGERVATVLDVRTPRENVGWSGLLDYAVTKDQTMRFSFGTSWNESQNLGIGNTDVIERGYSSKGRGWNFRAQNVGPVGRRMFLNTRFQMFGNNSKTQSVVEKQTFIINNDGVTTGGAQRIGGTGTVNFTIGSDLDYVRGRHSLRTGVQIDGTHYRTDANSNYLGTFTFASYDALSAGTPRSYTRRIGDPNIEYWNVSAGFYIQDDFKIRKNLSITPGVRIEAQTHLNDYNNIGPRIGFTWAPFKSGRTTLRGSWGIFYDWLSTGVYEQTIRFDGERQRELNIINPSFPDPGSQGVIPATNKYLLGSDVDMARTNRVSAGASQTINKVLSVGGTFAYQRGGNVLWGQNLNAPVNGVRPQALFANVVMAESVGSVRSKSFSPYMQFNLAGNTPPGPPGGGPLFSWRRGLYVSANYTLAKSENNTDGAFTIPATTDLAAEWGPSSFDTRQRLSMSVSSTFLKNLNLNIYFYGSTAPPITVRTGLDDNGDTVFNDRPAGFGRNSERTIGQWSSEGYISYSLGFGKRTVPVQPGIMINSTGGGLSVSTMTPQATPRYRINLGANINNLFNRPQYGGFSGIITSPLFLQPTSANGQRRITFNANLSF